MVWDGGFIGQRMLTTGTAGRNKGHREDSRPYRWCRSRKTKKKKKEIAALNLSVILTQPTTDTGK